MNENDFEKSDFSQIVVPIVDKSLKARNARIGFFKNFSSYFDLIEFD
jgi:hypothetical protein